MNWQPNHKIWRFLILAGTLSILGLATVKAQNLDLKTPVERSIKPGTSDSFEIALTAGQFIQVTVVQQEYEVTTTLITPTNEPYIGASGMGLSSYKLAFIAKATGRYRLEIRTRQMSGPNAHYKLNVDVPHEATSDDEKTADASHALQEANNLLTQSLFSSAIESYRKALELLERLNDREALAGALQHLGLAYLSQKDFDDAFEPLDRAIALWRMTGDWKGEWRSSVLKISTNTGRGYYSDASADARELIARARSKGDSEVQRSALQSLYSVLVSARDPEDAIEAEQQLLDLEPSPDTPNAAQYFTNIAVQYLVLHQPRTSIAYREKAAEIYKTKGQTKQLGTAWDWISLHYRLIGDLQRAQDYSNRVRALDPSSAADWDLLARLGKTDEAIEILNQEIVGLHSQDDPEEGGKWLALADIFAQAKHRVQALDALGQSLIAWPPGKNPDRRIEFLAGVAMHYENLGESAAALSIFQEYLREVLAKGADGFPQYPGFLAEMARSERDLGMLDQARAHLETAINLREAARARIASPELAATFFTQSRAIFDVYIDVLMRQGHIAEALEVNERARAHALIANLGDSISKIREGVAPEFIEQERILQNKLNQAANLKDANKTQTISAELAVLRGTIRQSSPAYASLTQPTPLMLSEIRTKVLGPGTTMLEFAPSDVATSYVWEVTTDNLRSVKLPPRSEIDAAARRVNRLLSERTQNPKAEKDLSDASAALSKMVLGPLGSVRGERLLIVTDGILDFVPFSALPDPITKAPLIASHEIVRLPSASALAVIREGIAARRPQTRRDIAILADPVFNARDERLTDALSRSLKETGLTLPRLAFSLAEANSIVASVPRGNTVLKTGLSANRNFAISNALSSYRIVHFATHGILNSESPDLSGLVLSMVDEGGKPQDGFLRLHDIYNLHLNADLVVLSACQTALGNQVEGEGIISLSRGFFYAGAARVLASLWTVDDSATAALMGDFYRNLFSSNKMTPAAALRAAQMKMQQSPRWSSPYYWAGFELQGEWK